MTVTIVPWFNIEDKDEMQRAIISTVRHLSEEDYRLYDHTKYLKMYSGKPQSSDMGFYIQQTSSKPRRSDKDKYRVNYNVIKSVIDTLVAKACLNPPKVSLVTDGGCITDRIKAKSIDKAVYMAMRAGGIFQDWGTLVKHSLIHGDLDIKVYADSKEKKVKYTRILPVDNYVSKLDSMYGKPICYYQTTFMLKDVIFAKYPEFKEKYEMLYKSAQAKLNSQFVTQNKIENVKEFSDYIEIVEAWKVQLGDVKGKHTIVCNYGILLDEEYTREELPIARLTWNKSHVGFYSSGIPEQLESKQSQINQILSFMTEAAAKSRSPILFVQKGTNDDNNGMVIKNNEVAQVGTYTGANTPQWHSFSGYPPTEFERLQWLIKSCYEEVGLNQMSSTGKNILGSGASKVALQEFTNIETDRFQEFGKSLDNFMIALGKQTISALKELRDSGVKEIKGEYKGLYEKICLEALDLDKDEFEFSVNTSSMLPMSISARKDLATDLYNNGMIDQITYLGLLNLPDIEQTSKLKRAPRDAIEVQVEKLIESKDKKYLLVNENTDLAYGLQFVISLICQYGMSEEEEDVGAIELLESFKLNLTSKINELGMVAQAMAQNSQLPGSPVGKPASVSQNIQG
jgi:hypothetical protein